MCVHTERGVEDPGREPAGAKLGHTPWDTEPVIQSAQEYSQLASTLRMASGRACPRAGSSWPCRQSLGAWSPAKKARDPRCAGTIPRGALTGVGSASLCSTSVRAKR